MYICIEQQTNKTFEIKLQRKQFKNKYLLCKHNRSQTRILVEISALQKNNKTKSFQLKTNPKQRKSPYIITRRC